MNNWEVVIPQILAMGLMTLRQRIVMPRIANNAYSLTAGTHGSTVEIPVPDAVATNEVSPSNILPTAPAAAPTIINVPVTEWHEAPFFLTDKDMVEVRRGTVPMKIREAIKALAKKVEDHLWSVALGVDDGNVGAANTRGRETPSTLQNGLSALDMSQSVGTPGTTPFAPVADGLTDISAFLKARARLDTALADDEQRYMVIHPDTEANLLQQRRFSDMSWNGDKAGIIKGMMGERLGVEWIKTTTCPSHDSSAMEDFQTAAAGAKGATTLSIDKDATAFQSGPNIGDVFTISGDTTPYMIIDAVKDKAASNTTAITVNVSPALVAVAPNNTEITAVNYLTNLLMQRDFLAFVSRPFSDDGLARKLGSMIESRVDPVSGLTLRLEVTRQHKQTRYSFDMLWGAQRIRDQFAQRVFG